MWWWGREGAVRVGSPVSLTLTLCHCSLIVSSLKGLVCGPSQAPYVSSEGWGNQLKLT